MLKSKNCKINFKDEVMYITFPIFEKEAGVKHCFSTRIGGVSEGRYSSMNLSYSNGDETAAVDENFKRICSCIDVSHESVVKSHQTHTVNIANVTEKGQEIPEGTDGLVTNVAGITLCSSYADCVPLLFYDPKKRVVASSHSGWRGTAGEIGRLTIEKMQSDYGCNPQNILAAIGPAICKDCYEVDETVISALKKMDYLNLSSATEPHGDGHYLLDLKEICRQELIRAGVKEEHILVSDICTCCNSEYLHSHRATKGERGNLCAFIALD